MMQVQRFPQFSEYQEAVKPLLTSAVYPFQLPWYQAVFAKHFSSESDIHFLGVYEDGRLVAAGAFEVAGETALFLGMKPVLGGQEVTDYGDLLYNDECRMTNDEIGDKENGTSNIEIEGSHIVGQVWEIIGNYFNNQAVKNLQLDFVRQDSLTYQRFKFPISNFNFQISPQEVAPYIDLPPTWETYLESLPRVKRKELKRKIRRLEEEKAFKLCDESSVETDFEDFIRLHRLSDPAKNQFMTEPMKQFFRDIMKATHEPWQMHLCLMTIEGKRVAAVLAFYNHDQVLFYNSGYDPEFNYYSVGLILKAFNLKYAIEKGLKRADWLRGNERYKYDLGSKDMQLYRIEITL